MKIINLKLKILNKESLILSVILLIALFFRIYKLDVFFIFEHDQDLFSWIVKDIWTGHHLRLIGQVTSIEGVFIGPYFYYLLVPFFVLSGMNPVSAAYFGVFLGLLTVGSIYFVFSKFFGKNVGLFGAAIYASSLGPVFQDRWIVPTDPTTIWCVWFLYTVFALAEGKTKSLIVAAILIGTIWDVHIALLPLMPLLILAFFLSKQKLTLKTSLLSLGVLIVLIAPFLIFELKHNFLQTKSLLFNPGTASGKVLTAWGRFLKIIDSSQKVINGAIFDSWNLPIFLLPILSVILAIFSIYKKFLTKKQALILVCWVLLIFIAQEVTKNPISEYYFTNFTIIPILLVSIFLGFLVQKKQWKFLALGIIIIYSLVNTYLLLTKPQPIHLYPYKKAIVDYIKQDVQKNNYPCISVNFIAKYGTGVGFRYLVWWEGMHQIQQNPKTPLYTIVIPYDSIDKSKLDAQFGYFGVILPKGGNYDFSNCNDPSMEPIPLLGFTN